jgi:hypothetical protein
MGKDRTQIRRWIRRFKLQGPCAFDLLPPPNELRPRVSREPKTRIWRARWT